MGDILWTLLISGLAGWITGKLMKGQGYGFIFNIVLGIVGGWIGSWLFGMLGIYTDQKFLSTLITAVAGAAILVFVVRKIRA